MVKKSTKKLLLIVGGAAVVGYLLLRKTEEAVTGIIAPFAGLPGTMAAIPAAIQAGAADVGAGAVNVVGATGMGLVEGVNDAILEGLRKVTRQPLRTYEPVPDVRQIPLAEQIGWTEQPVITVEKYEAIQAAAAGPQPLYGPVQPEPLPPVEVLQKMQWQAVAPAQPAGNGQFWVNPVTGAQMLPYVAGASTPPSVLRLREQDIYPAIRGF